MDTSKKGWEILFLDGPAADLLGLGFEVAVGKLIWDVLELPGQDTATSWGPFQFAASAGMRLNPVFFLIFFLGKCIVFSFEYSAGRGDCRNIKEITLQITKP